MSFVLAVGANKKKDNHMKHVAQSFILNIAHGNLSEEGLLKTTLKEYAKALREKDRGSKGWRYYLHKAAEDFDLQNWREVDNIISNKKQHGACLEELYCSLNSDFGNEYYYFLSINRKDHLYFFSKWEGWSKDGYELRSADPVRVDTVLGLVREDFNQKIYLIDSFSQLFKWRYRWRGNALVNERLLKAHWPKVLQPRVALNFRRLHG